MPDIYEGLDDRQREAVQHGDSPLLVLAGPGSGKTRMLTHRVAHLVQARGVHPRNILVTTFTNKAAQEMEDRLEKLIEAAAWELNIGTTHSLCSRIIRQYGPERVGLKRNFTTYDADDQRGVVGDVVLAMVKETAQRADYKTGEIVRAISFAKDCGIGPDYWPPATPGNPPAIRELYAEYDRRLRQANAADFGDLQVLAVRLLEQNPDVLAKVRERFQFVLVDEYQDVNPIQAELFYLLCNEHRRLTVVGDTNQSVYAFRSATPKFALQFGQDWKDGKVVKLERNYRSTKTIVRASNEVIKNNAARYNMTCYTENPEGEPIRVMALATPEDEATRAAYLLSRHHGNGVPWSQMAILYRLHRSSRAYESALIGNSIPYHLHGSIAFFDREEVKDLLAWMRICVNPADVESFKRACGSVAIRMGKATVGRVIEFADAQKIPVLEAAARAAEIDGLAAGARSACRGFVDLVGKLLAQIDADNLVGVIVDQIGYNMTLNKKEDAQARTENIRELGEAYGRYHAQVAEAGGVGRSAVEMFLAEAVLNTSRDKTSDGVWVGSVHAAKGTEFDVVLVVDCEDNIFPHAFSISNPRAPEGLPEPEDDPMEEERRLWYVALTRARKAVYLLWARTRMMLVRSQADNRAFMANQQSAPSPFLAETRAGGAVDVRFGDFTVPKI